MSTTIKPEALPNPFREELWLVRDHEKIYTHQRLSDRFWKCLKLTISLPHPAQMKKWKIFGSLTSSLFQLQGLLDLNSKRK